MKPITLEADKRRASQSEFAWNYDRSEILVDGIVHTVGLGIALIGGIVLVLQTIHSMNGVQTASVFIYAVGLLVTLGISAAYNLWPVTPVKWVLRRFDHAAIYLLIAATYTPFVVAMKTSLATTGLLIGIWLLAAAGIALKFIFPGRLDGLSIGLYVLLGWSGLILYDSGMAALSTMTLWLIAIGGVFYSTGIVFHLWEGLRFQNAIWHAFVLIAALCHYTAVFACTVGNRV